MRKIHHNLLPFVVASIATLTIAACSKTASEAGASAKIEPLASSGVHGTVSFVPHDGGVRVEAKIEGLSPGDHGIHIHEYGDCSAPDGMSAGEHFNPDKTEHGAPKAAKHHAGDLGNISSTGGTHAATLAMNLEGFTLDTGPRGILGRSVVIHAAPDDYVSQPAGNSGGRVACGIILSSKGETRPVTK